MFSQTGNVAVALSPTGDDDRDFLFEIDGAFQNQFVARAIAPDFVEVEWLFDQALSLSIIAEGGAFQNRGDFDFIDCCG